MAISPGVAIALTPSVLRNFRKRYPPALLRLNEDFFSQSSEEEAPAYVFGYFVANDVSASDWQFHTSTVSMVKSFDTHGPIGPWIVTADEVADPQSLTCVAL